MDERYKIINIIDSNDNNVIKTAFDTHNDDNKVIIRSYKQPIIFNDEFIELYKANSSTLIDINYSNDELTLINRHFDGKEISDYINIVDSLDAIAFAYDFLTAISKYNAIPTYLQYMFTLPSQILIKDGNIETCQYLIEDDYYDKSSFGDVMSNVGSTLKLIMDSENTESSNELGTVTYFIESLISQEASFTNINDILLNFKIISNVEEKHDTPADETESSSTSDDASNVKPDHFAQIHTILSRNNIESNSSSTDGKTHNKFNKLMLSAFITLSVLTLILLYVVFTYL